MNASFSCPQCGGGTNTAGDCFWCRNAMPKNDLLPLPKIPNPAPLSGWVCPLCGTAHSPYTQSCRCNHHDHLLMNPVSRTPKTHPCPACSGTGVFFDLSDPVNPREVTCSACSGDGVESDHRTYYREEPDDGPEMCRFCHSKKEPYFSRVAPLGYYCPDCGESDKPEPA